ncbi:MAG: hypothetical protein JST68_30995 [Bacteroidetes bacterium]|nr:hypothetical protein [Bacteroidota bacterium]
MKPLFLILLSFLYLSVKAQTPAVIDSLNTRNDSMRIVYLYKVSLLMEHSDGELSEALGVAAKRFIEKRPNQFVHFLYINTAKTKFSFEDKWQEVIAGEFMIDCEKRETACAKAFFDQVLVRCMPQNRKWMQIFAQGVEVHLKTKLQKH